MKRLLLPVLLALSLVAPVHAADNELTEAEKTAGWKLLFDGKDASQSWRNFKKETLSDKWAVQDGAITGKNTKENAAKENTFLIWEGEVGDFELTCKYKLTDDKGQPSGGANSGIQYRSKVVKPDYSVVAGYQADFEGGKKYSGILYEEKGRGILAERGQMVVLTEGAAPNKPKKEVIGSVGRPDELQDAIKAGDWNEYRVVAKGNQLKHFINGRQMVSVKDETAVGAKTGVLAFQLHAGPPMMVQFKAVLLKQ